MASDTLRLTPFTDPLRRSPRAAPPENSRTSSILSILTNSARASCLEPPVWLDIRRRNPTLGERLRAPRFMGEKAAADTALVLGRHGGRARPQSGRSQPEDMTR